MPRTISGNGPWAVSNNAAGPVSGAAVAAIGVTVVCVVYGHQILRVLHDVVMAVAVVAGVLAVAGTLTGVLVWRWRRVKQVAGFELRNQADSADQLGLDAAKAIGRDVWPFVRPDGTPIDLPERARSQWN